MHVTSLAFDLGVTQTDQVRGLLPVVGAQLARLSASEDFMPLLPVFQNLSYVHIHAISTFQPRDPVNVLALAVLPALRTLRVTGNTNSTHTRFVEELTQLEHLILIHTVPFQASEGNALPQSLRSLEMDLWGYQPSVQSKLPCRRVLQQFSGKLKCLSLGKFAGQFNPVSQLGALACLQQLKHLSLCFADLSSTVDFSPHAAQAFTFPHLLSLHIVLQDYASASLGLQWLSLPADPETRLRVCACQNGRPQERGQHPRWPAFHQLCST